MSTVSDTVTIRGGASKLVVGSPDVNGISATAPGAAIRVIGNASANVIGSTPVPESEFEAHTTDAARHFSIQDRMQFDALVDLMRPVVTPGTVTAPAGAIPDEWFASYFARNAQPGVQTAPGHVFVSRVPFARTIGGQLQNSGSTISATEYPDTDRKLLDNTGLQHKCSTDKVENADDYVGKHWAFYWARCNYVRDSYGVKWITAVEGETVGLPNGTTAVFDPKKPTGTFGPAIWTFCVMDTAWGLNSDGSTGHQLWGIGDRPWDQINGVTAAGVSRKDWLIEHGVREVDYNLWSTAKWYDPDAAEWKPRSYIVESAYCGTAELDATGHIIGISSKLNEPVIGGNGDVSALKMSHNNINTLIGNKGGGGTRAVALGIMFDIVKNATKDSQSIRYGVLGSNNGTSTLAAASLLNPGYVFPFAAASSTTIPGGFEVGCTVYLRNVTGNNQGTTYVRSTSNQIGRIAAVEDRDLVVITSEDPNIENPETEVRRLKCLVIDPNTVEPFYVRNDTAKAAELSTQGYYACATAIQGIPLAGETTVGGVNGTGVIGKHDGCVTSTSNGRHSYRVQGMEMACGVYQCAADGVCIKGTGAVEVTLPDGTTVTPSTTEYVYLYAPSNIVHRASGTLAAYISGGYVATGVGPVGSNGSWILNGFVDTHYGMWRIDTLGGSSTTGHRDALEYTGASPAEYLSGGSLSFGAAGGSACLALGSGLGYAYWSIGARD